MYHFYKSQGGCMGFNKRMFLDNESFKAIGWESELIVPKGDGIFGDRKPFTWHQFSIYDGHNCVTLDEKEANVVMKQLVHFLGHVSREEERLKNMPKKVVKPKKAKK
jgi:hypothetical protein